MKSLDLINEFEDKFDVASWTIDNVAIWPAVRIHLITKWEKDLYHRQVTTTRPPRTIPQQYLQKFLRLTMSLESHFKNNYSISNDTVDIGIWQPSMARTPEEGGFHFSRFSDALQELEGDSIKIRAFELSFGPGLRSRLPKHDITFRRMLIWNRAFAHSKHDPPTLEADLPSAEDWCRSRGLSCSVLTKEVVVGRYQIIKEIKDYYLGLIKKYRMKATGKVCWYDEDGMALAWASREAGIPNFDIQHGVAGAFQHRAYVRWNALPRGGYSFMPSVFLCWSEADVEAIRNWADACDPKIEAHNIGNPWFRMWSSPSEKLLKRFGVVIRFDRKKVNVAVTLQKEFPLIVLDLIDRSPSNYFWWIRAHPCHPIEESVMTVLDKRSGHVNYIEASKMPLPYLLQHADSHITQWSAAAIEAHNIGLKTILCHPEGARIYSDHIERGDMVHLESASRILDFISRQETSNRLCVASTKSRYYRVSSLLKRA